MKNAVPLLLTSLALVLQALPLAAQSGGDVGVPDRPAATAEPVAVDLPPELDRVLRDYEAAWQARDAAGLAALFAEDGFVMAPGVHATRGREAIEAYYLGRGGPLSLRAYAYATDGDVGWILGGYAGAPEMPAGGKYTLTLVRDADGRWLIMSDMDNRNR